MRFQYSTSDPSQDEFDSLPRIPLTLRYNSQQLDVLGLVDSGSTVSVLPHDLGLQLGARWDDRKANLRLAGNLGKSPAMPLSIMATIEHFAPVQLVFAWVKAAKWSSMYIFIVLGWNLKLNPSHRKHESRSYLALQRTLRQHRLGEITAKMTLVARFEMFR